MQKAIIVTENENLLNEHLRNGWRIYDMCAMPSSTCSTSFSPTCLVIIEKVTDNEDKL